MTTDYIVVFSTIGSIASARRLATVLVEESLAACVNILTGARSVYRWEGKIVDDEEVVMIIKTTRAKFDALESRILALHEYDVPEILAVPAGPISASYEKFLSDNLS